MFSTFWVTIALCLLILCAAEGAEVSGRNRGRHTALLFPHHLLKTWGSDFCPDTSCCYMGYYYPEGHSSGHTIELSSRRGQIMHILMQKRGHHWGQSIIFFFSMRAIYGNNGSVIEATGDPLPLSLHFSSAMEATLFMLTTRQASVLSCRDQPA